MKTYLSHSAMMDTAKLTKIDERDVNDAQKRKRKRGQDGTFFIPGETSGVLNPKEKSNLYPRHLPDMTSLQLVPSDQILLLALISPIARCVEGTTQGHTSGEV